MGSEELSMKKLLCKLAFAVSIATLGSVAFAHHSLSAYDITKSIEFDGTVKEFQWGSPHCWLIVDVPNGTGGSTEWVLEAGTPVVNNQFGWKRTDLKSGDKVKVTAFPVRDGSAHGALMKVVLANGRVLEGPLATYLKK
jgi:hypothetical protein